MSKENLSEIDRKYVFGTWRFQEGYLPKLIVEAEECYFIDSEGKKYLDFSSQLMCNNLGVKNESVVRAMEAQARRVSYIAPGFATESRATVGKLLAEITPPGLVKSFFSTSGTEANEAAIKISRLYTGGYKIISRYRSYHGSTTGSRSLTGDPRRFCIEPAGRIQGIIHAPDAYCYRCPLKHEYPDCGVACADYVDYIIRMEDKDMVAAVFVEPIVGSNGIIVPPDEYLPRLREITEETNTLLVVDEVMTGFGRTGEWFAVNHWNVVPDIITVAKGLTGAHVPFGATIVSKDIANYFEDRYFCVGHTFSGHPLGAAAAVAAIEEYRKRRLIENARRVGKALGRRLEEVKGDHRSIGDVRGKGLFWGIELTRDRETKEPFSTREDKLSKRRTVLHQITSEALKRGLYLVNILNTLIIAPPLMITQREVEEGVNTLDEVLKIADKEAR
ncbi:MAG: aspartate aminotransferase family protein [Candidatus Geothermarchaeales archaeon]